MKFITVLFGGIRRGIGCRNRGKYNSPEILRELYLLMYRHVLVEDRADITKPINLQDTVRNSISSLLNILSNIPNEQSYRSLLCIAEYIAENYPESEYSYWIKSLAKQKAERESDIEPWSESQVVDFYKNQKRTPQNHRELAEFAVLRLVDLKDNLEHGDSSYASLLMRANENEIRTFIGGRLRENADGRYSILQEEELADGRKPDIRFHGNGFDAPVPVELKIADNWSGNQLFERLENQLCGDYLRDSRSNRGIFLLIRQGKHDNWEVPNNQNQVDFNSLISSLQEHWQAIFPKFSNIDQITVIGIDLTVRSNR